MASYAGLSTVLDGGRGIRGTETPVIGVVALAAASEAENDGRQEDKNDVANEPSKLGIE